MWREINLLYELKSPVHIGFLPSKAYVISPTRYYIPGKNFWGAYTKALTEALFDNPNTSNYRDVGEWFKKNVRFTYFYICYTNSDKWKFLIPEYSDEGLKYGALSLSEFQNKFIGSFISTAIDREKGTAKDESLHEIEYISQKYSTEKGTKNTRIFGKMFIKKNSSVEIKDICNCDDIEVHERGIAVEGEDPFRVIFIGGELNYGFGKIERVCNIQDFKLENIGFNVDTSQDDKLYISLTNGTPILGHMRYSERQCFSGDVELISGRGYSKKENRVHENPGRDIVTPEPYLTPGTVVYNLKRVELDYRGIWNSIKHPAPSLPSHGSG